MYIKCATLWWYLFRVFFQISSKLRSSSYVFSVYAFIHLPEAVLPMGSFPYFLYDCDAVFELWHSGTWISRAASLPPYLRTNYADYLPMLLMMTWVVNKGVCAVATTRLSRCWKILPAAEWLLLEEVSGISQLGQNHGTQQTRRAVFKPVSLVCISCKWFARYSPSELKNPITNVFHCRLLMWMMPST